jgi:hypothetical protein
MHAAFRFIFVGRWDDHNCIESVVVRGDGDEIRQPREVLPSCAINAHLTGARVEVALGTAEEIEPEPGIALHRIEQDIAARGARFWIVAVMRKRRDQHPARVADRIVLSDNVMRKQGVTEAVKRKRGESKHRDANNAERQVYQPPEIECRAVAAPQPGERVGSDAGREGNDDEMEQPLGTAGPRPSDGFRPSRCPQETLSRLLDTMP